MNIVIWVHNMNILCFVIATSSIRIISTRTLLLFLLYYRPPKLEYDSKGLGLWDGRSHAASGLHLSLRAERS